MTDPMQFSEKAHPVRRVLVALGHATIDGGAIDLLSCAALDTWGCPQHAWPELRVFNGVETEARCRFVACTHALDGNPLQSEEEWAMESDESVNIKQEYFLPRADVTSLTSGASAHCVTEQLAYAREHASLIKVAPVWQSYSLGAILGRGNFASVKYGTRRALAHPTVPKHVAIKIIDSASNPNPNRPHPCCPACQLISVLRPLGTI